MSGNVNITFTSSANARSVGFIESDSSIVLSSIAGGTAIGVLTSSTTMQFSSQANLRGTSYGATIIQFPAVANPRLVGFMSSSSVLSINTTRGNIIPLNLYSLEQPTLIKSSTGKVRLTKVEVPEENIITQTSSKVRLTKVEVPEETIITQTSSIRVSS